MPFALAVSRSRFGCLARQLELSRHTRAWSSRTQITNYQLASSITTPPPTTCPENAPRSALGWAGCTPGSSATHHRRKRGPCSFAGPFGRASAHRHGRRRREGSAHPHRARSARRATRLKRRARTRPSSLRSLRGGAPAGLSVRAVAHRSARSLVLVPRTSHRNGPAARVRGSCHLLRRRQLNGRRAWTFFAFARIGLQADAVLAASAGAQPRSWLNWRSFPWCRPATAGSGLRSVVVAFLERSLLRRGDPEQRFSRNIRKEAASEGIADGVLVSPAVNEHHRPRRLNHRYSSSSPLRSRQPPRRTCVRLERERDHHRQADRLRSSATFWSEPPRLKYEG